MYAESKGLQNGSAFPSTNRTRRHKGNRIFGRGRRRVQPFEVRKRRSPCSACSLKRKSQGRIQTSTATVAVLKARKMDVEINQNDLIIETHRSGGAGGQHVNKTESAIRIIHVPTGTVVDCQDERRQYKNKEKRSKILRSRIYEKCRREPERKDSVRQESQSRNRATARAHKNFNFPQGRVTDHRIGLTLYKDIAEWTATLTNSSTRFITTDRAEKQTRRFGGQRMNDEKSS